MARLAIHPGEHIQEELDAMDMSANLFASKLGVTVEHLLAVLDGKRSINAEMAMRLGHFFGTSAQSWLNLQVSFDLEVAKQEHGAEIERLPTLQAA
jgi:addiction module HigA family antidote